MAASSSLCDLAQALTLATSSTVFLGQLDLAQGYLLEMMDAARASGDPYTVSRAIWFPFTLRRIVPVEPDAGASAAECLELAREVGGPTLLARARILNALALADAERQARFVGSLRFISNAISLAAIVTSMQDPVAGLAALLDAFEWHDRTADPTRQPASLVA